MQFRKIYHLRRYQCAKPTRLDYCQYLLSRPLNDTLTPFADHSEGFSHDMINRYLAGERIPPRLVWEHVKAPSR